MLRVVYLVLQRPSPGIVPVWSRPSPGLFCKPTSLQRGDILVLKAHVYMSFSLIFSYNYKQVSVFSDVGNC